VPVFPQLEALEWRGPTAEFSTCAERLGDPRLIGRVVKALSRMP
jgi:hypothetical protein